MSTNKLFNLSTLGDVLQRGIDSRLKELHTAMPGIIQSFDAATQTAIVQPAIKRIFKSDTGDTVESIEVELPPLINVPVQFPRGGGFSLTFPVAQGDECLIIFSERSLDYWHESGGVQAPGAYRLHALSDATALVGLSSKPNKVPSYSATDVQLKRDDDAVKISLNADSTLDISADSDMTVTAGGDITATATGSITATASGGITASAATVCDITAPIINLNGLVNISGLCSMLGGAAVTGAMTNNGTNIGDTHQHSQGPDSGGSTEQNTSGPF